MGPGVVVVVYFTDNNNTPTKLFCFVLCCWLRCGNISLKCISYWCVIGHKSHKRDDGNYWVNHPIWVMSIIQYESCQSANNSVIVWNSLFMKINQCLTIIHLKKGPLGWISEDMLSGIIIEIIWMDGFWLKLWWWSEFSHSLTFWHNLCHGWENCF